MGKQTKIVYTCDICGAESDTILNTCQYCNKDYCTEHGVKLIAKAFIGKNSLLDKEVEMCVQCADKIDKWKEFLRKELGPKPAEFHVKA